MFDTAQLIAGIAVCALVNGAPAFGLGYAMATGRLRGGHAVVVYLAALVAISIPCTLIGLAFGGLVFGLHDAGSYFVSYSATALAVLVAAPMKYWNRIATPE